MFQLTGIESLIYHPPVHYARVFLITQHSEGLPGTGGPVGEDGAVESLQQRVENIHFDAFVEDLPVGRL